MVDAFKDAERLMAQKKGNPDLRKPFVRERTAKKLKKQEEEEVPPLEETGDEYNDDLPDANSEGPYDPVALTPDQIAQHQAWLASQQQTASPPPPAPPADQQQYTEYREEFQNPDCTYQIKRMEAAARVYEVHNNNYMRFLGVFQKYLQYQKALLKEYTETLAESANTPAPAPAPAPTPVRTLAQDPEINGKKKKLMNMVLAVMGVLLLGVSFYLGTEAGIPVIGILAFIVAALGGGFLASGIKK